MDEMNGPIEEALGAVIPPLPSGAVVLSLETMSRPTPEELATILEDHRKWVKSRGKDGKRALPKIMNLKRADLRGANLHEAVLSESSLEGANLENANLQGASISMANLRGANLSAANLQGASIGLTSLHGANLNAANLQRADLSMTELQGADLSEANLQEANLGAANLQEASLDGANLHDAILDGADLEGTRFGSPNGLTKDQIRKARKWILASFGKDLFEPLELPDNHDNRLYSRDLSSLNLQGIDLRDVSLEEGKLEDAKLEGANLGGADLQRATLTRAVLRDANLAHTKLGEANLQDADLTGAKGLQGGQLAGANVSGAELPRDIAKFEEGLKVVEEASRNARKLFFAMLSACAYALLTIATTTDVLLLTNSRSSPLPIIRTEIPIVWFYIVAPLILLCLYFYFHLYMQRLWEGLAELPAFFPDGRPLDKKAYPWLLTGLVRAHVFQLKSDRPPLSHLQEWISVALAWWFIPATLVCFWLRYLPRQDWYGTGLHILLLVFSVWAGVMFYRLAVGTLRWDESESSLWKKPFGEVGEVKMYKRGVVAITLGVLVLLLSLGTINGVRSARFQFNNARIWVPYICEQFGFSPFANFREKDVSTKPANWSGKKEEIPQVKGAPLKRRNLRYVQAYRAFLVNADLREADLGEASLWKANLQEADLREANLQEADLRAANLQGADLREAELQVAELVGANLQKADLRRANLQGAYLTQAELQGADLREANLQEADLARAKLQGANLWKANLQGADFSQANLEGADLEGANRQGAKGLPPE